MELCSSGHDEGYKTAEQRCAGLADRVEAHIAGANDEPDDVGFSQALELRCMTAGYVPTKAEAIRAGWKANSVKETP